MNIWMTAGVVGIVVVGYGMLAAQDDGPKPFLPGDRVMLKESLLGCEPKSQDRLYDFIAANDRDAYVRFMDAEIRAGRCTMLRPGRTLSVEDVALFAGTSQVREVGATRSWSVTTGVFRDVGTKTGRDR